VTNDLRVLIDASIEEPTARALMSLSSLKAKYVADLPDLKDKEDALVMNVAIADRRIVVTVDKGFNEKVFKICEHFGIIIISTRSKHRAGFSLGIVNTLKNRLHIYITYINETNIRVKKHNKQVLDFPLS
jgi:predicted nuclease of predicted toxin-antitoxin system